MEAKKRNQFSHQFSTGRTLNLMAGKVIIYENISRKDVLAQQGIANSSCSRLTSIN